MNLTIPIISTILCNFFVINTRGYDILHCFYNLFYARLFSFQYTLLLTCLLLINNPLITFFIYTNHNWYTI